MTVFALTEHQPLFGQIGVYLKELDFAQIGFSIADRQTISPMQFGYSAHNLVSQFLKLFFVR
jgi:hypothetical protein